MLDHRMTHVKALWPRLNQPYRYDDAQGTSVPCRMSDKDAGYELHVIVTEAQAKELAGKMRELFNSDEKTKGRMWTVKRRGDNGLMQEVEVKSLDDLFKRQEDGTFAVKTQIKKYNDDRTTPKQYMQDGTKAPEGFELTTDSIIHVMVQLKAWSNPNACGISIRPRGVMVVELADKVEREETGSMFGDLVTQGDNPFNDLATGSQAQRAEDVDPFGLPAVEKKEETQAPKNNDLDDEIPF